ncbi:olfactory receptor 6M1-like [Salarias fasciatus]|uniref:olfactory receptor 6M1-like n=1 Tax=Salarias fasciatus TaxID=181472 RepID=UPI0011770032|nr:olfactory receptor 6M1-like [Salarias fasciatus]
MDKLTSQFNVTYITLVGHVELLKYRHLYFVIMFIVYTLILLCNFTIICLIMTHRSLREPMYIFIAALLLNSVLFSTVVYPKLLIDFLSDKQVISFSLCALQSLFFYSLEGSEFLLLAVMAFDRIVIVLYKSCKEVRMKAVQTCLPHLLVLISFSCLCSYDIIIARLKAGLPTTVHFVMTLQVILYHPLFNPVIYGLKMKEISKHLMKLFCRRTVNK